MNGGAAVVAVREVATFDRGEVAVNTLRVALRDVIIPLEMDVEGDPLQDDAVRLTSLGGAVERVLPADAPEVEADRAGRRLYYRFRAVPLGAYRVSVRIAGAWSVVFRDLVVRSEGVFCGGKKLETKKPEAEVAPPVAHEVEPEPEPGADEQLWAEQVELAGEG